MSIWYETFNDIFFITLTTIVIGFLGLAVKSCLKSKCESFTLCWGVIDIDRRVDLEVQQEIKEIEMGINRDKTEI
jgi:hypothetical protein